MLYTNNSPLGVAQAQTLFFNLKQIGIHLEVKYFDINVLPEKAATAGEPYDLIQQGWAADYADGAGFFVAVLGRGRGKAADNLDHPHIERRIAAANRLNGEARRQAWADLDVELMRDDPPWAPFAHTQSRTFVSRAVGCVLVHPVYGFDVAAACKR